MSSPTTLALNPGRRYRGPKLALSEKLVALTVVALLFLEHVAFGGARREIALGFDAVQGLVLAGLLVAAPWARREMVKAPTLTGPALLYAGVFLVAAWSLTPLVPGGPHPIWTYVDAPAAAAIDKSGVLVELLKLAALGCMFLVGWLLAGSDERASFFLRSLVLGGGLFAAWAFTSHLVDPGFLFGVIPLSSGQRLTAAFLSANTAGALFGVITVLAAGAIIQRLRGVDVGAGVGFAVVASLQRGAVAVVVLAFCLTCLLLSASRGAVVATVIALVALLCWEGLGRRWKLFGPGGIGLICFSVGLLFLLAVGGAPLVSRLFDVGAAYGGRDAINEAHLRAFLASPWLGYGLGSFDFINRLFTTSANYSALWNIHAAHDVYLEWLEETGVFGAAPMFLCIGWILALMVKASFRRARMTTWLRTLAAASLVLLIHGGSDYALQIPSISTQFACLLGLGAGLSVRLADRP